MNQEKRCESIEGLIKRYGTDKIEAVIVTDDKGNQLADASKDEIQLDGKRFSVGGENNS